ncbi:hypothetical protein [Deinococcus koreensis]|nr:hypothetical protein [Deinococcus koreensis]
MTKREPELVPLQAEVGGEVAQEHNLLDAGAAAAFQGCMTGCGTPGRGP